MDIINGSLDHTSPSNRLASACERLEVWCDLRHVALLLVGKRLRHRPPCVSFSERVWFVGKDLSGP